MNQAISNPFLQWKNSQSAIDPNALLEYFLSLKGVSAEEMLGQWQGGLLPSGHSGESQLAGLNWAGKEFVGANEVYPMLVKQLDGSIERSNVLGQACLREVCYHDKISACMIYDNHPTYDYFRRIDDHTLMGVMDRKGDQQKLYFYLYR